MWIVDRVEINYSINISVNISDQTLDVFAFC